MRAVLTTLSKFTGVHVCIRYHYFPIEEVFSFHCFFNFFDISVFKSIHILSIDIYLCIDTNPVSGTRWGSGKKFYLLVCPILVLVVV